MERGQLMLASFLFVSSAGLVDTGAKFDFALGMLLC
jgi:hypothetical protein